MHLAWFRPEDLGALFRAHGTDDSGTKTVARIPHTELVVIDDIGLLPWPRRRGGFYRVVDAAYENAPSRSPRISTGRSLTRR